MGGGTTPVSIPGNWAPPSPDVITGYNWELYNVNEDFSQANDLAAKMPDKLKEMQDLFYAEAKKYDVLPLDNSTLARFLTPRPSPTAGRTSFTYTGELSGVRPAPLRASSDGLTTSRRRSRFPRAARKG